ncbi:asparagine synthetase A [Candidatus Aminicenantes bacterium AH-873-B07]|jgi:asparaginyl-tRNA synthetase|nr:asparagine synthetase A [Candidatus Aminicenantes bacterium AH-873-B07]
MFDTDKYFSLLKSEKLKRAVKIQSEIIKLARNFLGSKGFVEILPVIISPITDPLTDHRIRGEIECYGFKYQLTKSMIFHKQISLFSLPKIFSFSPNVRIEPVERQKSGRHLIEFVQLDIEVREASREEVMKLCEEMFIHILKKIKTDFSSDLKFFERELKIPRTPFKRISYEEAISAYGKEYETKLSLDISEPIWLVDFPIDNREFYDKEYSDRPGFLVDMDLIYPEGYGEALSGGEREFQYEKIKRRIELKGIDLDVYDIYLQFAKRGLYPSAGFGIGIERLTQYVCGLKSLEECRLFAKLPGILGL